MTEKSPSCSIITRQVRTARKSGYNAHGSRINRQVAKIAKSQSRPIAKQSTAEHAGIGSLAMCVAVSHRFDHARWLPPSPQGKRAQRQLAEWIHAEHDRTKNALRALLPGPARRVLDGCAGRGTGSKHVCIEI